MIPEKPKSEKEKKAKLISVSEINSWLFCARKLYISKILGIFVPPNRAMTIGRIKHSIIENFSKEEEKLISKIDNNFDSVDLVFVYEDFIKNLANSVFIANKDSINQFLIDKDDILKKVLRDFSEDIKLRIASIRDALSRGFVKEELWKNLDSIYLSEIKLESDAIGLKGRVDRIQVSRKDNTIIPYELKSREDNIYHSDELQLTAYAMLLEPYYRTTIEKGIIEVGNNKKEIPITQANKDEVLKIADLIRNIKENSPPPMQSNFNKCRNCEFKEECMKLK
jgi:CRISPR-associated protein Cas4